MKLNICLSHGPAAASSGYVMRYVIIFPVFGKVCFCLFGSFSYGVVGFVVFETVSELAPNSEYHKGWP